MFWSQDKKGVLSGLGKNILIWFMVLSLIPLAWITLAELKGV